MSISLPVLVLPTESLRHEKLSRMEKKVQTPLKVEILRRNLTYKQVSEKLTAIGVVESEPNIRNKLARRTSSAVFFVSCLAAIGVHKIES